MTDDHQLDELERSQLDMTLRRRTRRSNRKFRFSLVVFGFVGFALFAAPSIISHTGIARSIIVNQAAAYGWQASVGSISVGWITPLSVKDVVLVGQSGKTKLQIQRIDSSLTATRLIRFSPSEIGELSLRGIQVDAAIEQGGSSIETDLAKLLEPSDQESEPIRASIQLQECGASLVDTVTQKVWTLSQSNAHLKLDNGELTGELAGVVGEPAGTEGAIQTKFVLHASDATQQDKANAWEFSLEADSFPISTADLVARRLFPDAASTPQGSSGETSGRLHVIGGTAGGITVAINDLQIRNLQSTLPLEKQQSWQNNLATLNGQVAWTGDRLHGNDLAITTDFASAELDGSFPTTISFVGTHDNPLLWMQSLQGIAKLNVDLAALSEALPGLLPIREDATLVSGTATAIVRNQTTDGETNPRTELSLNTRAIRARSAGRLVVIEPISIDATVTDNAGSLLAEQFTLQSSFAEASGKGSLRGGDAQFSVDFGRLHSMLRPIVDLSETNLGGNATGNVQWSVVTTDAGDQWSLSGTGEAQQLLVTLPNGHRIKRSIVQTNLTAKGNWAENRLQRLSQADFALGSSGVLLKAKLTKPVDRPDQDVTFPVKLDLDGRLENLSESLGPWLPAELASAEGRVIGTSNVVLAREGAVVTNADFEMVQPRFHYQDRWYSQPKLTIHFDGTLDLGAGTLTTPSSTIAGESISLAIRGEALTDKTDLEIAWKADLEGLQNSIGETLARAAAISQTPPNFIGPQIRPIGYRTADQESYRLAGRCEGTLKLSGDPDHWKINSELTGTKLELYSETLAATSNGVTSSGYPAIASPDGRYPDRGATGGTSPLRSGTLLWSEPRLKLSGPWGYQAKTGQIEMGAQQLACDWFAGSLSGEIQSEENGTQVIINGPSKVKLDVLAARLSEYFGASILADGVHESEVAFNLNLPTTGDTTYDLKTDIGWTACDIVGVRLGQAKLPVHATTNQVRIDRTTIPVIQIGPTVTPNGQLPSAGGTTDATVNPAQASLGVTVDLSAPQTMIRLDEGSSIESVRITPQAAATWLKYLTPLAAGATQIDGLVSAQFDEVAIWPDQPTRSIVRGNLEIGHLIIASGPLTNQLIQGVRQIKSMTRLTGGQADPVQAKTLIEMPPQTVPFVMADGYVAHQRMFFKVDNAELMTSGRVGLDSQLDLVAQVPLNARWLGSDLQGLAGQNLAFPIKGSLSRPYLDESAVRRVMAELVPKAGAEVIQNRLDSLIQKQLGDQVDQLNSSLEKIFKF
ncbi:hypothetical protein [Rhodopirellula sp. MGV]|uniref:hypothetical protein n=1 Tax=Rhodopirellula sp. MGV TaxID=2023130 RepID=UPI00117A1DCD|nr:hypothetical protein [Rhodopirellula sp. MGV]